jgi:hypothetical protein
MATDSLRNRAPSGDAAAVAGDTGSWRVEGDRVARVAVGGILAGLVSGFLVGGIGGRLAMRLVAVQTEDRFQGLTTDDGATTGEISLGGTIALVVFVTLVGVLGGLVYVAVRPVLPSARRARAATWALVTGVIGGSLVVQGDGVDFTLLGSPVTSVVVFVGLMALYGWVTSAVAERLLRPGGTVRTAPLRRLAPAFILLLPGGTIVFVLAMGAGLVALLSLGWHRRVPSAALQGLGRVALVVVVGLAATSLVATVGEVV